MCVHRLVLQPHLYIGRKFRLRFMTIEPVFNTTCTMTVTLVTVVLLNGPVVTPM